VRLRRPCAWTRGAWLAARRTSLQCTPSARALLPGASYSPVTMAVVSTYCRRSKVMEKSDKEITGEIGAIIRQVCGRGQAREGRHQLTPLPGQAPPSHALRARMHPGESCSWDVCMHLAGCLRAMCSLARRPQSAL
jgi:hypothetical protein